MSTPGSSPQHRPAGVSPLSLSTEARRQQASPTLSPLSPITQVRGQGGGQVGGGKGKVEAWLYLSEGLLFLPGGHKTLRMLPTLLVFIIKFSSWVP